MRPFVWLFRAFLFFALFAFALNNRQEVVVHWFFGHAWRAPMVIVVLVAFAAGCALGVLAMTPAWWQRRQRPSIAKPPAAIAVTKPTSGRVNEAADSMIESTELALSSPPVQPR